MKTNMTAHADRDRRSRLEYIIDTVGVGKVIVASHEIDEYNRPVCYELTTTGIIIVKNKDNMVVTAFFSGLEFATKVWQNVHGSKKKLPPVVAAQIKRNSTYRALQPC